LPFQPAWSQDGKKVVYFCRRHGLNFAIEVPSNGGKELVLEGGANYALKPQYSRDGKSLYYASNIGNRFRIWRKSLSGSSAPVQVTAEDAEFFKLSNDGNSLYFLRSGAVPQLVERDLGTHEQHVVFTWTHERPVAGAWDVARGKLYFVQQSSGLLTSNLVCADLATKRLTTLGTIGSGEWEVGLTASSDGQTVLVSEADHKGADISYVNLNVDQRIPRN